MSLFRNFLITLSNSTCLNEMAKKIGPTMGANRVVTSNTIEQLVDTIGYLNAKHIDITVGSLGGFINSKAVTTQAKNEILEIIEVINRYQMSTHMSVGMSPLDGEFGTELAYQSLREVLLKANTYDNIHINIDMEKYSSLSQTLQILDGLKGKFRNVDTVIQGCLFKAERLIDKHPKLRLRLVKGAYKENDTTAYQSKKDIDKNYISIIEKRLLNAKNFTSITAHDDNIINHVKQLVKDHHIEESTLEFQMLYGFCNELAKEIARQEYHFIVYVPYDNDWSAYSIRRPVERPQSLSLTYQEFISTEALKKIGLVNGPTLGTLTLVPGVVKLLERWNTERLDNP